MNSISYKDLKAWYLDNPEAVANAKKYFGDKQPNYHTIGYYHPSGANWSYQIGIVKIERTETNKIFENKYFEVVTQFGIVKAARGIVIPEMKGNN